MRIGRDWSIRRRMVAAVGWLTGVTLVLGFAVVVTNDIRTFRASTRDASVLVARVAADSTIGDLAFADRDSAGETLSRLGAVPGMEWALLTDARGEVFASFGPVPKNLEPFTDHEVRFVPGGIEIFEPVIYREERYGALRLRASTAELGRRITAHLVLMAALLAVLLGLTWLVASRLAGVVAQPILDLAAVAETITATEDYSLRVGAREGKEIGSLARAFDGMLEQIQRREQERDQAEHRTREKSAFLANMSHELRTPLNSIIGFSEVLQQRLESKASEKELRFVHNIHSSGQHLLGIINDILDLSKVEAGRMELSPELISLRPIVDGVVAVMRPICDRQKVTIEIDIPERLPAMVADSVKVKQILYNLLSNAVKFSPAESAVRVEARALRTEGALGTIEIRVIDRGIGIDPKDHAKVFEAFRQADQTTSRKFGGTGLGLALVRSLVEMHGGSIRLDSALGAGSTFIVELPMRAVAPTEAADTLATGLSVAPRVLIVEDDTTQLESLRQQLEAVGLGALLAATGEDGLRLARRAQPAAIILDLILPGELDGWRMLHELKADASTRTIPVVVYSLAESRELGLAFGADDVFVKGADRDRLFRRISELVSAPRGARVLVIDDDPAFHDLVDARLASEGFRLEHAHDGRAGVAAALATKPDVILLDLLMAGMDGFEVATELADHAELATVPVLVLTAKELTRDDRRALGGKVAALVRKGSSEARDLVGLIRNLLGRRVLTLREPGERNR